MNWYKRKWNELNYFLLIGIVITMPFGVALKLNNLLAILLFAHSLSSPLSLSQGFKKLFLPLCLLYVLYIIGLFYASNFNQAFFDLEKKITFLLFPLALARSSNLNGKYFSKILNGFLIGCLAASIICLFVAVWRYKLSLNSDVFFYYELTDIIAMHPIYLAMYICLATFIFISNWLKRVKHFSFLKNSLCVIGIIYMGLFLILLSARTEMLAFTVIIVTGLVIYGIKKKRILQTALIVILFLSFVFSSALIFPNVKDRLKEAINYKGEYSIDKQWGGRALRFLQWDCCLDVIKKNFLVGVGGGDTQDELQKCYIEKEYGPLLIYDDLQYNAHNQYFEVMIGYGVIGLSVFLACLLLPGLIAIKANEPLFLAFVILIAIGSLTESILELNKGIVFFSFFSSFFIAQSFSNKETDKKNVGC
ncbi:MAG: O-antigen ligase family protein [Flammeovirgaceae bacterium]|nr:O-antigen ligase family protein [Flammeovirgaceae bacterium]